MATGTNQITYADGSLDFSGGVDSIKVPTVASQQSPGGLARNELAWLINAGVRDGGITQRTGWKRLGVVHPGTALYQGGYLYSPSAADPYLVYSIGGKIFMVRPDFPNIVTDLSTFYGFSNPATAPLAHFTQGEQFLIIQAGDNVTLPLFYDGTTLRRSKGITTAAVSPGSNGVNEIPAATAMDYYQGRLWYAQGRRYSAGDIVGGQSGTAAYNYTDSILNVTESPIVIGGDGFTVPSNAGNIRALFHNANINAPLGEGQLFIGTRKAIYAQQVPVTRNDWIAATANSQPVQTIVQLINGPVSDRCLVKVNGDIFYQTLEPSIASLFASVRNFGQWGNRSISANENRLMTFNDRGLMQPATGILFENRILQGMLPEDTPQGIVHKAIVPMDVMPVSSFATEAKPVWEGMYEGLNILQLFAGDFGGRERAFALVVAKDTSEIELWELTSYLREDYNIGGDSRVTWLIEFPAFTWGYELELKKLIGAELWIDKLLGTVEFTLEWRPDSDVCWKHWRSWKQCSAKNTCETVHDPACYPLEPLRESFRATMTLPTPPESCVSATGRPASVGYQMQCRLTIKGWCRVRGFALHGLKVDRSLYTNMVC